MPHGHHIYANAYDMAKATMCAYSQSDHALTHWKCVFLCCAKCPGINIPDQEIDDQYSKTSPILQFVFTFIIQLHVVQHMTDVS